MPDGARWWTERICAWASASGVTTNSQRTYREHLVRWPDSVAALGFDRPTSASAVTRTMVLAFKERGVCVRGHRAGQVLSPATRAMDLTLLRQFLAFEKAELALDARLFRMKRCDPVNVRWLDGPESVDALSRAAQDDSELQAALLLMAHVGLRSGEVRALLIGDLQLSLTGPSRLVVRNGKGGKPRLVAVPTAVRNALLNAVTTKRATDRVYPWGRTRLARGLSKASQRAGLGQVSPHDLRRSFARFQRRAEVKMEALQRAMGHARYETTARYVGQDPQMLDDAAEAYNRYLMAARDLV